MCSDWPKYVLQVIFSQLKYSLVILALLSPKNILAAFFQGEEGKRGGHSLMRIA